MRAFAADDSKKVTIYFWAPGIVRTRRDGMGWDGIERIEPSVGHISLKTYGEASIYASFFPNPEASPIRIISPGGVRGILRRSHDEDVEAEGREHNEETEKSPKHMFLTNHSPIVARGAANGLEHSIEEEHQGHA